MRVFKWSPDFDVFCESPIAAIWCNLIGLPIHLFDTEALFAIGKLIGNPIQVDRATANKTRLSFARICVEIDITKVPTEEIILDLCGKEIIQQIKWDKIPTYCLDCKHVGHTGSNCYANGKRERPPKRNYYPTPPTHQNKGANGKSGENNKQELQVVGYDNTKRVGESHPSNRRTGVPSGSGSKEVHEGCLDIMGDLSEGATMERDPWKDERRRTGNIPPSIHETELADNGAGEAERRIYREKQGICGNHQYRWRPKTKEQDPPTSESFANTARRSMLSTNKYYMLMEDGVFDTETFEDGEATGMHVDQQAGTDLAEHHAPSNNTRDGKENSGNTIPRGRPPPPSGMDLNC